MDPLTITAAAGSLTASIFTLIKSIGTFVTTARNSRIELDAICRELVSIQVCLEVIENDRINGTIFGGELETSVHKVVLNIEFCCKQVRKMLAKFDDSSRFCRSVKWAMEGREQMDRLRSTLETNKSALQIALQLNTVSIVTNEAQRLTAAQSTSMEQCGKAYDTIQQISQKVDNLTTKVQDHSPALRHLQEAMADLSSLVKDFAAKPVIVPLLVQQSCQFAQHLLASVHHLSGVLEIESKVEKLSENPFFDPFNEVNHKVEHGEREDSGNTKTDFRDGGSQCSMCSSSLSEAERRLMQTKMQQLGVDWWHAWTVRLAVELDELEQKTDKIDPTMSDSHSMTDFRTSVLSSTQNGDNMPTQFSGDTIIDSGNKGITENNQCDIRSFSSSSNTLLADAGVALQRLQIEYDSVCKENQSLLGEATRLRTEKLDLQDDVFQLHDLLHKTRTALSSPFEDLQRRYESLQYTADQAKKDFTNLRTLYQQLCEKSYSDQEKAQENFQEIRRLRSRVSTMSQEIANLNESAVGASNEIARLKAIEETYSYLKQEGDNASAQEPSCPEVEEPQKPFYAIRPRLSELPPDDYQTLLKLHFKYKGGMNHITVYDQMPKHELEDFISKTSRQSEDLRGLKILFDHFFSDSKTAFTSEGAALKTINAIIREIARVIRKEDSLTDQGLKSLTKAIETLEDAPSLTIFMNSKFISRYRKLSYTSGFEEFHICWMDPSDKKRCGFV